MNYATRRAYYYCAYHEMGCDIHDDGVEKCEYFVGDDYICEALVVEGYYGKNKYCTNRNAMGQ